MHLYADAKHACKNAALYFAAAAENLPFKSTSAILLAAFKIYKMKTSTFMGIEKRASS
jgi:hypothetical protein